MNANRSSSSDGSWDSGTDSGRAAFTMLELVVALAIISLLLALLLPAISQAREASRAVTCREQLSQIGVLSHSYESAHGHFPRTSSSYIDPATGTGLVSARAPHQDLVSTLGSGQLAEVANGEYLWVSTPWHAPSAAVGVDPTVMQVGPGIFRCPSDSARAGTSSYRANLGVTTAMSDPSVSESQADPSRPKNGAFENGKPLSPAAFRDGLSSTAFFSEDFVAGGGTTIASPETAVQILNGSRPGDVDDALSECRNGIAIDLHGHAGWTWWIGGFDHTWYNHVATPNPDFQDCAWGPITGSQPGVHPPRSHHLGGVNVLFADGACRLVSNSVDLRIWRAFGTRNGVDNISF